MRTLTAVSLLLLAALALPIVLVVIGSFTAGEDLAFPPEGYSLRWYAAFLDDPQFLSSFWTSIEIAALTSLAAGALGSVAAIVLARSRPPGSSLLEGLLTSPLAIPAVAMGLGFLVFFSQLEMAGTKLAIVLAHTIVSLPFVLRLITANLAGYNWTLERAAASLGGSPVQVAFHVTLPLILPGVLGGMIFAFIVSFDEVVISLFLSGPDAMTLPVRILSYLENFPSPVVLAAGSVLVFFAIGLMLLLEYTVRIGRAFGVEAD